MKKMGIIISAIGAGFYASAVTMVVMEGQNGYALAMFLMALGICSSSIGKTVKGYQSNIIVKKDLIQNLIYNAVVFVCFLFVIGVYVLGIYNGHTPEEVLPNLVIPVILIFVGMFIYRYQLTTSALDSMISTAKSPKKEKSRFSNKEERRISFVVREVLNKEDGVYVQGVVHGKIKKEDTIYLYDKDKKTKKITKILIDDSEVSEATDRMVTLVLEKCEVHKFDVISSVEQSKLPLENPVLRALVFEYAELRMDSGYLEAFIKALVHSKFVVPVIMESTTDFMKKSMKIGFMAVNRTLDGVEEKTFAIFTDGDALTKWKSLFENGKHPTTLTISFQDAVQLMMKGHSGIVINAFGPKFVYLPQEMIDIITKQESYRKEFGAPGERGLSFDSKEK